MLTVMYDSGWLPIDGVLLNSSEVNGYDLIFLQTH